MSARLRDKYRSEVHDGLKKKLGVTNPMLVPTLDKIVVNMGVGEAIKLREGMAVGASVTLRGDRMWEFFDRLIAVAIPRIRDFRGLNPDSFDGRGNYSFGVTEQLIFPEIDYDKVVKVRGMDVTIGTTAKDDEGGRALLEAFGFPFRRQQAGV